MHSVVSSTNHTNYTENLVYKPPLRQNFSSYSPVCRQLQSQNNSHQNCLQDFQQENLQGILLSQQQQVQKQSKVLFQNLPNEKSRSCSRGKCVAQPPKEVSVKNINLLVPVTASPSTTSSKISQFECSNMVNKLFDKYDSEKVWKVFIY